MYKEDYNYANSRLQETIVMHGENPVFVNLVTERMDVEVLDVITNKDSVVHLSELNLVVGCIGYVNEGNECHYVVRRPVRRDYRQGIRYGNLFCREKPVNHVPYKAIARSIKGEYPTLNAVIKRCTQPRAQYKQAWHHNWAMDSGGHVWHKGDRVGVFVLKTASIELEAEYSWLNEALLECMQ